LLSNYSASIVRIDDDVFVCLLSFFIDHVTRTDSDLLLRIDQIVSI
jgi:hypothetical protein